MKILFDTDIGDDIDDAYALALAVRYGFEIVGVTTVYSDVMNRARIAKKLLKKLGQGDIPVYAGSSTCIDPRDNKFYPLCQYTDDLKQAEYAPDNRTEAEAIDFIVDSAKKYGKALTVVGIGPLTNLAKAILKDQAAMRSIDKIVIMGGAFFGKTDTKKEWNILCDPQAAKIVFESGIPLECVGIDVTLETEISSDAQQRIIGFKDEADGHLDEGAVYLSQLTDLWYRDMPKATILHDPLVIYYLARPEILDMERINVYVETEGEARARTVRVNDDAKQGSSALCARTCRSEKFVKDFLADIFHFNA